MVLSRAVSRDLMAAIIMMLGANNLGRKGIALTPLVPVQAARYLAAPAMMKTSGIGVIGRMAIGTTRVWIPWEPIQILSSALLAIDNRIHLFMMILNSTVTLSLMNLSPSPMMTDFDL